MNKYPFRVVVLYRHGSERKQIQHNFETLADATRCKLVKASLPGTIQVEILCVLEVFNPPAVPQHHQNGGNHGKVQHS